MVPVGIGISAVAFDYGGVLSLHPAPKHRAQLRALTRLSTAAFEQYYAQERLAYDRGAVTGQAYWSAVLRHASRAPTPNVITQLIHMDALSWLRVDQRQLQWVVRLKAAGLRTAILSNIPSDILDEVRRRGSWLKHFDVAIFSCEVGCVKPEAPIYHLLLQALRVSADQALFIDDTWCNVETATQLGLHCVHYTSFAKLQQVVRATYALPPP